MKNQKNRLKNYLQLKQGLSSQNDYLNVINKSLIAVSLPVVFLANTNQVEAQIYHKTNVGFTAAPGNNVISTLPIGPNASPIGKFHIRGKNSSGYFTIELYDAPGDQTSNVPGKFNAFIKRIPLTSTNFEINAGNLNEIDREYFVDGFCKSHGNCDWGGPVGTKIGYFGFRLGTKIGWARAEVNTAITPYQIKITDYAYTTGNNVSIKAGQTVFAAVPSISIATMIATSAENSGTALKYQFTSSIAPTSDLTITFEVSSGSSAANDDFTITTGGTNSVTYNTSTKKGTIVIKSGQTTADLLIVPDSDAIIEDDETVIVTVANP